MNRLHQLAARIDQRLQHFEGGAIDLREDSNYGGCLSDRPYFPKLYISGKRDASLMSMPGEGTATIEYKVQSRRVDESNPDGPRYGADIEIRSIDPIAGGDDGDGEDAEDAADEEDDAGDDGEDTADLGSTIFLHQFGCGVGGKGKKKKKFEPFGSATVKATEMGSGRLLHQLSGGDRDRDAEGRFDRGDVAKPDDFAMAGMSGKKKLGIGAGLGVAAGSAALAAPKVRKAARAALAAAMLRKSALV